MKTFKINTPADTSRKARNFNTYFLPTYTVILKNKTAQHAGELNFLQCS